MADDRILRDLASEVIARTAVASHYMGPPGRIQAVVGQPVYDPATQSKALRSPAGGG